MSQRRALRRANNNASSATTPPQRRVESRELSSRRTRRRHARRRPGEAMPGPVPTRSPQAAPLRCKAAAAPRERMEKRLPPQEPLPPGRKLGKRGKTEEPPPRFPSLRRKLMPRRRCSAVGRAGLAMARWTSPRPDLSPTPRLGHRRSHRPPDCGGGPGRGSDGGRRRSAGQGHDLVTAAREVVADREELRRA